MNDKLTLDQSAMKDAGSSIKAATTNKDAAGAPQLRSNGVLGSSAVGDELDSMLAAFGAVYSGLVDSTDAVGGFLQTAWTQVEAVDRALATSLDGGASPQKPR